MLGCLAWSLGFGHWSSRNIAMSQQREIAASPWPHRWAVVLACATFPLVWVGGLVTTTDSGMAVPDWPTTYGYNLFLYPLSTWVAGPWDVFVEHGHRLLGALVGMLTIGLVVVVCRTDQRNWLRWLAVAALLLVIAQGLLGGMRVIFNERSLAMFHGTTGPLFFALTIAMAVFTSRLWQKISPPSQGGVRGGSAAITHSAPICVLAIVTCILVYLQIILGAVLRHVPVDSEPATFALAVRFHLFMAAVVALHIVALVGIVQFRARPFKPLAGLAWTLAGLLVLQLALGAGTWIIKFAAPSWAPAWATLNAFPVAEGGWLQTHVITAHVAIGSLMLATSLALALYAVRHFGSPLAARRAMTGKVEAAV
jgi:cytochrome c oxidase assembly protein subunit 15